MKQALLVVNAFLVVAVSYLLYKQFTYKPSMGTNAFAGLRTKDSALLNKKILIAYINMDSIQNNYTLAKEVTKEVEKKRDGLSQEMKTLENSFNNKMEGYQKKGPSMNEEQVNAARQDLDDTRRQINEKKQALDDEFGQWVRAKNLSLIKDIQDYLKKFNADGTYSFIFSYEPAMFYYKDTAYDITREVLKGLNEQYTLKNQNAK